MKKEIRYILTNPTENRTILVETAVSADEQPAVAAKLMALEPTAEQVGFLAESQTADTALRMAGGEFCANATMSAAAICGMRTGRNAGTVTVEVSGTPEPIEVSIAAQADGSWQGIVHMPRPTAVENVCFSDGQTCPVVTFDGISHVIMERDMPRSVAETIAKRRCTELSADALGLMFFDCAEKRLKPLVYVPRADTLFWEKSCGSGTAAVGAWLAKARGQTVCLPLEQPGGTLEITASPDGALRLRGAVRCVYKKSVQMDI